MGTMHFGYNYDRGVKVGYNISYKNIYLPFVSSKDKKRIINELANSFECKKEDIDIQRDTND